MLRQAMFSLVAGGLVGWASSFVILKNDWLTRATIRFLRIAMWFPFLVLFAAPYTFQLGIAATSLASIYHYLTARSFLEISEREAFRYVAGEVTLQAFFFSLLAQIWVQRWNWLISFANNDATLAFVAWGLILTVLAVINWLFRRTFRAGCGMHAILIDTNACISKTNSFVGVLLLAIAWLALWQLTCVSLHYDEFHVIPAMQRVGELLITREVWHDILASLTEIGVGMLFGGLFAFSVAAVMQGRIEIQHVIVKFIPYTYLTPIVLWPLVVHFVLSPSASMNWYRSFFLAFGHKMMGVGLLTFFPLLQALWSFRDAPVARRWVIAVGEALPMAFVAMCFGELYAASAGIGFRMVIASATYKFQEGLAWFLITVILLSALSMILRLTMRFLGFRAVPSETAVG